MAYRTSIDHILAELARIDLLLCLAVARARQGKSGDEQFAGLYIADADVDALLSGPLGLPQWARREAIDPRAADAVARINREVAGRTEESLAAGMRLPLVELTRLAGLSELDVLLVLLCLAPDIDVRYERVYAYLHDDVTRRRPTVDLLLNVCCGTVEEKIAARARFANDAPLARHLVVTLKDDADTPEGPLLAKRVFLDPRIASYLLGDDSMDSALARIAGFRPAPRASPAIESRRGALPVGLADSIAERGVIAIEGPRGAGKKTWIAARCARDGSSMLIVDGEAAAKKEKSAVEIARRCAREAGLRGAALVWDGLDPWLSADRRADLSALLAVLAESHVPLYVCSQSSWDPGAAFHPRPFAQVKLPRPEEGERLRIWTSLLGGDAPRLSSELPRIAGHYRFTPGQIGEAIASARARARGRGEEAPSAEDLDAGCRGRDDGQLAALAQRIAPRRGWEDLVLPAGAKTQLREIADHVRHRAQVMSGWGFARKHSGVKGTTVLFNGPSGTGKTLTASLLAGELGLELYKIDLSRVVSKYIGETEKNLSRVFETAADSNAILFFDEADALFGKRSEVKDAHDRYANIETGYLLQRMEEHEGISILATNLRRNMDEAFVRRMGFAVVFPMPDEDERRQLWSTLLPLEAPRAADIDASFLAKQFKLSGGNIRNAVVAGAFLAAARGGAIAMADLLWGVYRELEKMGMTPGASQFGPYAGLFTKGASPRGM